MYNSSFSSKPSNGNPHSFSMNTSYRDEYDEDEYQDDQSEQEETADQHQNVYNQSQSGRGFKKRRVNLVASNYEFAPRTGSNLRDSSGEWTEHETIVLLEVWGNMFLQLGRNSLRSEDWVEVAEKVSGTTRIERSDMECRNRLDTLKKKFKKEKAKIDAFGGYVSKWVFFKKLDTLLNAVFSTRQQFRLPCGVDSGEYVFANPKVYLDRSNVLDEMGDSPEESEYDDDDEDEDEEMGVEEQEEDGGSIKLLADSIQKFGKIYEKVETSKRKKMMELETMRMDFQRELELQQKHILEKAQAEIEKLKNEHDDETNIFADDY